MCRTTQAQLLCDTVYGGEWRTGSEMNSERYRRCVGRVHFKKIHFGNQNLNAVGQSCSMFIPDILDPFECILIALFSEEQVLH